MIEWYDEKNEAIIVMVRFPDGVDEAVHPNEDGTHTIFLNEQLCELRMRRAYLHALAHIHRDDFRPGSVQAVEASA